MKHPIALSALLTMMTLAGCASSPATEIETRVIEVNCAAGIDTDQLAPGDPPEAIRAGQDWRDYGEELFVAAGGLHARLTAAHGALEACHGRQRVKGEKGP